MTINEEPTIPVVPKLRVGGFTGTSKELVGWVHRGYSIVPDSVSDKELRVLRETLGYSIYRVSEYLDH